MKRLREEIRDANLTKTEKVIADFMLDHYAEACFMTSTDVADRLDVSESSVIRFCRTLGYKGYMDFQKNLQKYFQKKIRSIASEVTVPAERLASRVSSDGEEVPYIETHFQNALGNLENAILDNRQESFDKAAKIICQSNRKYIVSSRANSGQGDYSLLYMKHMLDNVTSANYGAISVIDHMADITKDDCVIVFSFPRYSQMDKLAMEMAFEAGAKIIVITDKQSALLAQYASVLFTVSVDSNTFFNSYVGVQFVTETLCDAISHIVGVDTEKRLKQIDKYLEPLGMY